MFVGHRSINDILPPRALLQRQISSNASVPIYEVRSQHKTFSLQENRTLDRRRPLFAIRSGNKVERSPWRLPWHAGAIRGRLNALVPQLRDGLSPNAFMLSAIPLALVRALHVESASGLAFFWRNHPPHGRGVVRGGTVENGVAVGAGVAVPVELGVATCACAPAKKATKPTRTHTLMTASLDHIRMPATGCRS